MEPVRVDICYRPLRIAWAIQAGDMDAFRRAVRMSHSLWGGRFNPIVVVDREEEAQLLVEVFRADVIVPVGDSESVKIFEKRFPYLINPLCGDVFIGQGDDARAQVLDMHNALVQLRDTPEWKAVKDAGVLVYDWKTDDPLADVFLMQFGSYPPVEGIGIDYRRMLVEAAEAQERTIDPALPLLEETVERPTISSLSRFSLRRHHRVQPGWDTPGFFVGDAAKLDDLVCFWNLRAADIPLVFIDPKHLRRYERLIPAWDKRVREELSSRRREWDREVAVWGRDENRDELRKPFGDLRLLHCPVSVHTWNGRNVRPPMMHFDSVSTLGVVGQERGRSKVSFALSGKPFCGDVWFHTQHLVASVSSIGGLYGDEQHTLNPPFIPELNEFYARQMHVAYNELRIEPGSIGLVIDAAETDTFLYALPVLALTEKMFGMANLSAKLSSGGLIVRQLIARMGGLQGGRVFKIPGVRRLLRTHGPTGTCTKDSALQLIAGKDADNPNAKFDDYRNLYIEQRPIGTPLKPNDVFSHLVEKGLFRIGVELRCPSCGLASWTPLDVLKQRVLCEFCGDEYNATRQLANTEFRYRRSGVLGAERNAQGAVPVALTLQQLDTNLSRVLLGSAYCPSLSLAPASGTDLPECEVDFVWFIGRPYPRRTAVILGECKDRGPIPLKDFQKDVRNLRRIADALPRNRFKVFILFSKLSPFTEAEIECVKGLNGEFEQRVILLTDRELEPYHMYERTKLEFDIQQYAGTPEDMASSTDKVYFPTGGGASSR